MSTEPIVLDKHRTMFLRPFDTFIPLNDKEYKVLEETWTMLRKYAIDAAQMPTPDMYTFNRQCIYLALIFIRKDSGVDGNASTNTESNGRPALVSKNTQGVDCTETLRLYGVSQDTTDRNPIESQVSAS